MSTTSTAVSAPGKVLFSGGFLVLDRAHTGLVFGLNARIHVHAQIWNHSDQDAYLTQKLHRKFVFVESPQFLDARWLYKTDNSAAREGSKAVAVEQILDHEGYTKSRNKFVEVTLQYVLTYLLHLSRDIDRSIKITILADNDYYSQTRSAQTARVGFTNFGVTINDAHKTGLGSSAALVTALVSTLVMFHCEAPALPQKVIHNLAQAAHCAAQGKVGSGFDIAAAVYGSCLYRRFTPAILENVGDASDPGFGERLHQCVDDLDLAQKWDVEVLSQAVEIPDSLLLVMCDVDCGSETPGMVRKLLQWRKDQPAEASFLWTAIQQGSEDLCNELRRLAQIEGIAFDGYSELSNIILTIRSFVREMSVKSDVPVEPTVITELLDYCTSLPGVVGGVAPGAGGYDAVALLVKNDVDVVRDLQDRLENWTAKEPSSGAVIGKVRLLGVKQDKEGARLEDASRYTSWL